jgi:hypothetical protein
MTGLCLQFALDKASPQKPHRACLIITCMSLSAFDYMLVGERKIDSFKARSAEKQR